MSRPLRIEYSGAFYHVMNRGAERKAIFNDPASDRALFLNVLADAARLWKIRVHAYSLMPNHYHILLETPLANLSRAMRHIDGVYTQRFNRKLRRDGPLFRGRFKSILVEKESYFIELVRYIHLNGVKAALAPHPAADLNCSHPEYLGRRPTPPWLVTEVTLAHFGSDPSTAVALFDAFVQAGIPKEVEDILARPRWPAILGAKEFAEKIRETFHLGKPVHPEKPQERMLLSEQKRDPLAVIERVKEVLGGERSGGIVKRTSIYFLRYACHLSYAKIGEHMGGLGDSGIKYHLDRLEHENKPQGWDLLCKEFAVDDRN